MISGLMQEKNFAKEEVTPWSEDLVSSWSIVTMSPTDLVDRLDVPWGWFGSSDGNVDRLPSLEVKVFAGYFRHGQGFAGR